MPDMSDKDNVRKLLAENTRMEKEHSAWRQVCLRLEQELPRRRGMNDCDELCAAIRLWGEELVRLRVHQSDRVRIPACLEARAEYGDFLPDSK